MLGLFIIDSSVFFPMHTAASCNNWQRYTCSQKESKRNWSWRWNGNSTWTEVDIRKLCWHRCLQRCKVQAKVECGWFKWDVWVGLLDAFSLESALMMFSIIPIPTSMTDGKDLSRESWTTVLACCTQWPLVYCGRGETTGVQRTTSFLLLRSAEGLE